MVDQVFTEAPEEVTRYFRQKGNAPSFDWRDVAPQEHARTFTVAKTAGFDVLADIRSAVEDAITKQQGFEEFRSNLEPLLRNKGWWGRKLADDPSRGIPVVSQLGSVRRLRTIHWANVTTARAAGEWERIQRTKAFLPFLKYTLSLSERRRPEHQGWVGIILPADHEWWQTHYPPNGWLCKCGVRQITRAQAERDGYDPELEAPVIETRPWFNNRTGKTVHVPIGIDPGWQSHPGINRMSTIMESFGERLQEMSTQQARNVLSQYWLGNEARAHLNAPMRVHMPVAISQRAQQALGSTKPTLTISNDTAATKLNKHKVLDKELLANADTLLEKGEWRQGSRPGAIDVYAEDRGQLWKFVITKSADGFLYLRTIFATSSKRKNTPLLD